MLFKILINYLTGYVNVEIEGYYVERFINTCMNKGIFLWGINREKTTILYANLGAADVKEANEVAKQHGCMISVKKEKGVPFLVKRYKDRKIFFIALLVLIILIFLLSKFIWNIEVQGTNKIDENEIIEEAENEGLKVGKLKNKIDTEKIINKIRMEREDISWIGIEMKGTNVIIKIVEAEEKPDIIDENDYCNIVAKKDGEITKVSAQNGTIVVEAGNQVKKGDVLIAGWMEGKYTDKYYVNSNGEVKAKINYAQSEKIDKKEIIKEQTGKINRKYSIKFNNFKINFYKRLSKFENYDTIYAGKKLLLFPNFYLPIEFIRYTNYEVNKYEVEHSYDEAKALGEERAKQKLDELIEGEVVNSEAEVTEYDTYYNVTVKYEVIEEIGTKEKIEF